MAPGGLQIERWIPTTNQRLQHPKSVNSYVRKECYLSFPPNANVANQATCWQVDPKGHKAQNTSSEGFGGYKVKLLLVHDRKVMICYVVYIIFYVACLPCGSSLDGSLSTYM